MVKKHGVWIALLLLIALPVTGLAVYKWYQDQRTALPVLPDKAHRIAAFELLNQHAQAVTLDNWNQQIVIAGFFFTHCPVICPKMINSQKQVQNAFPDEALLFVNFSVDPLRDSAAQLQQYARRMHLNNHWQLLTGDKKKIYTLARKSFLVTAEDGDGGEHDFIHSDKLVLIDKHRRIRGYYSGTRNEEVQWLIRDLARLKKEE